MQNKQARKGRAMSMTGGIICGVSWGALITLAAIALMAKLVDTETLLWESVGYGILVTLMISSFTAAKIAEKKVKRRKLMVCTMSGIAYFGLLLVTTALFFGGKYYAMGETALLVAGGSGLAALTGKHNNKRYQKAFAGSIKGHIPKG